MTSILPLLHDDAEICNAQQMAALSGLSLADLMLLVEHGLLHPVAEPAPAAPAGAGASAERGVLHFRFHYVAVAHAARRLRDDFELEGNGWLLAVRLWMRLQETEQELRRVRATLSRMSV